VIATNKAKTLITGGAGFIGSHLVDALMTQVTNVHVFDNLSSGKLQNIKRWLNNPDFKFTHADILNQGSVCNAIENCFTVFHLAANPEARVG